MSQSNLPAVPEPPRVGAEVVRQDVDSWVTVMRPILALAERVYDTDFVPKGLRGSPGATAAAMLYGREVGLPPMTSLNVTHVVEGKPGLSAEAMRALVFAASHEIEFMETTGAVCRMRARRRGAERWTELEWTIDAARAAGLAGKGNWKNYPRAMLQARCTTELCRMVFPDVIHGFRSLEELEDMSEGTDESTETSAQQGGTTTVRRQSRKRAAKRAAPKPEPASQPAADLPPLPGEPGFDEPGEEQASAASDDAGTAGHAGDGGSDREGAADAATTVEPDADTEPEPAPGPEPDEDGAVDAEVVEEEPPTEIGPPDAPPAGEPRASRAQLNMLFGILGNLGVDDVREERLLIATTILGRDVDSFNELTKADAKTLIDALSLLKDKPALNALLDELEAGRQS